MDFDNYINGSTLNLDHVDELHSHMNELLNFIELHREITKINITNNKYIHARILYMIGHGIVNGNLSHITDLDLSNNHINCYGYLDLYLALSKGYKLSDGMNYVGNTPISLVSSKEKAHDNILLQSLNLSNSITDELGFHVMLTILIENSIKLKEFYIDSNMLSKQNIKDLLTVIAHTRVFEDLETLNASNCSINKEDAIELITNAKIHLPQLLNLHLTNDTLSDEDIADLNTEILGLLQNS